MKSSTHHEICLEEIGKNEEELPSQSITATGLPRTTVEPTPFRAIEQYYKRRLWERIIISDSDTIRSLPPPPPLPRLFKSNGVHLKKHKLFRFIYTPYQLQIKSMSYLLSATNLCTFPKQYLD
ncbi:hypothetical protein H4Q26_013255 [Puccinia striiformis f. sp. tritici PST-130]|nr:hypothetical protein H4Q26_013255 [Puccinia striiformis f. sp. tritici PST-130]